MVTEYKPQRRSSNSGATSKSAKGKDAQGFTRVVWASVSFTPEQKRILKEAEFDIERFFDRIAFLVEKGHKFSCNPCTSDGFVGASLWGHVDGCSNQGFGVSGEGGTLYAACKSLSAKLDILDCDLTQPTIEDEDDFR